MLQFFYKNNIKLRLMTWCFIDLNIDIIVKLGRY